MKKKNGKRIKEDILKINYILILKHILLINLQNTIKVIVKKLKKLKNSRAKNKNPS